MKRIYRPPALFPNSRKKTPQLGEDILKETFPVRKIVTELQKVSHRAGLRVRPSAGGMTAWKHIDNPGLSEPVCCPKDRRNDSHPFYARLIYKPLIIFSVIVAGLFISACDYKPSTIGLQHVVFVFADSLLWLEVKEDVEETFNAYVHTPRLERSFFLSWRPLTKLNSLKKRKNLFFIGTLGPGEVNDYLRESIPPQFTDDVIKDKSFYFFKDDLFSRGQFSLFMIGQDVASFKRNFAVLKGAIFKQFNKKYFQRLEQKMFELEEQEDQEEYLANFFGYKVRVQHDYFIAHQNLDEKYVWLRRMNPDRWLSIWRVFGDSSIITQDSIIALRNKMTGKYYSGDVVVENETNFEIVSFQNRPTYKMTGTWVNDSLIVGGPFRTYVVPNKKEKAYYLVDIAVMAPTKNKKPYLDQLEVIAGTFSFVEKNKSQK